MLFNKPLLVYNPNAGGGRGRSRAVIIKEKLINEAGLSNLTVYETKSVRDAYNSVDKLVIDGNHDLVISIGGDGTISEILNGLMRIDKDKRPYFFPIPGGSGNSLLRDFNILDPDEAIKRFKQGCTRSLDSLFVEAGKNNEFKWHCFNLVGMGFISNIARFVVDNVKKIGGMSYMLGTFLAIGNFRAYKVKLKDKEGSVLFQSDRCFFLTASNSKYTGGAIMIAPDADTGDGLMDICVLHDIGRLYFLRGFIKALKGKHTTMKGCKMLRASYIEIEADPKFLLMPDGELEGESPLRITVIPAQIKAIV